MFVAEGHPKRGQARYGPRESRPPPAAREHAGFVHDARANEAYEGKSDDAPYKLTGVKYLSPLAAYPFFDLVWDILMDLMHIIPGIWKRHIFGMFNDRRKPSKPKPRRHWSRAENARLLEEYEGVLKKLSEWALSKEDKAKLDERSRALGGVVGWIRNNIEVCTHAGALNSHDWLIIVQGAGDYLFEGLFPDDELKLEALYALLQACNACLKATSAYDSENREEIDKVKLAFYLLHILFLAVCLHAVYRMYAHVGEACRHRGAV